MQTIQTIQANPTNIYDLIQRLDNQAQIKSLEQITHDEWYSYRLYLTGYTTNTERPYNVEGTFTVLGAVNSKNQRETYSIKMYKEGAGDKGTFWCSCPDHKFNSQKKNKVCKHICFIVCRFGQVYDVNYFNSKQMTGDNYRKIKDKAEAGNFVAVPINITSHIQTSHTIPIQFTTITREITAEDSCPICFDEMLDTTTMKVICCPECHNNMHKECMEVWLERNNTCVYCRSNAWGTYK